MSIIIAVDGPASSGKGTIAKYLANRYNLKHLDTGLLYRKLAYEVVQKKIAPTDQETVTDLCRHFDFSDLSDPALKNEAIGSVASQVAIYPNVRSIINAYIQNFAASIENSYAGGVFDGRDVGTVIFPNATLKLFITATPEVRSERRRLEMQQRGTEMSDSLAAIQNRDQRDSNRSVAPLVPAVDACIVDTSCLKKDEVEHQISLIVEKGIPGLGLAKS